jgi:hypothetical protein
MAYAPGLRCVAGADGLGRQPSTACLEKTCVSHPFMIRTLIRAAAVGAALTGSMAALPALAQMDISQIRAANLARMEAERINGGLTQYFTANCMHQKGGGSCMVNAGPNGYLFDFLGGPPGWEVTNQPATRETRILISPDGTSIVNVEYNGAPR